MTGKINSPKKLKLTRKLLHRTSRQRKISLRTTQLVQLFQHLTK